MDDAYIQDELQKAFEMACLKGHLNIAQMLFAHGNDTQNPVNIHVTDEYDPQFQTHASVS